MEENTSEQCLVYGCFPARWQFYPWKGPNQETKLADILLSLHCSFYFFLKKWQNPLKTIQQSSLKKSSLVWCWACVLNPPHPILFFFTNLFTIFMRAAKGPFSRYNLGTTINAWSWTNESGPPLAWRSWHESGPIHHNGFGGDEACGTGLPRCFRVVCPIQHLHKRLRQSSCAQSCCFLCLHLRRSGDCRRYSSINNAFLRLIQMEERGSI